MFPPHYGGYKWTEIQLLDGKEDLVSLEDPGHQESLWTAAQLSHSLFKWITSEEAN